MNLLTRVARLESITREAQARDCAECGGTPGPRSYRLEFGDGEPRDGPERCPACGRQLVFRLEFDRQG